MQNFIPLSVPNLTGRELEYVTHAVETGWVSTGGEYVNKFEEDLATYVKVKGAVSCQNGTSGLHIALKLCHVSRGDEVIAPTLTFIAAVNPIKYIGAEPIFMDCDDSLCIDPEKIQAFCEKECKYINGKLINKKNNRHIKAIIIVHVFGNMADMEALVKIANKYNLKIVEDATEALGTYYTQGKFKGKFAGTIGDVGVYSFNGNKIITTGGGGMIVSDNIELLKKAKHLTTQAKSDELYYTHDEIGFNYRLTNLQAALGLAQLEKIEEFIQTKEENYKLYSDNLKDIDGLEMQKFNKSVRSNYWFYGLYIGDGYPLNREETLKLLSSKKVQARPVWGLINEQKPYISSQTYKIVKAKNYVKHVLNIPCSSNLSSDDVQYVIKCLRNSDTKNL